MPRKINENSSLYRIEKETGTVRIIFFSRIHPKKNLEYALEVISKLNCKCFFDIYGPIENKYYWDECKKLISKMPNNISVSYGGYLDSESLSEKMGKYDLFFFPTLSENFGHVIAESLSESCNILFSDNTPWNDVNNYKFGKAISLNNEKSFIDYIEHIAALTENEIQEERKQIPIFWDEHFDIERLKNKYISLF